MRPQTLDRSPKPWGGDGKSSHVFNRKVSWTAEGIQYEADAKHVEILTAAHADRRARIDDDVHARRV